MTVMATAARTRAPSLAHERRWWDAGGVVAGIDEVGRGAWAGPVTYAAVVLPRHRRLYRLRDSKILTPSERERLAARIRSAALAIGIGHAWNDEIDRLGMSEAMRLAARRAVEELPLRPDACLLDGNWDFLRSLGTNNECIVGGDARCASIAAASIVAKVVRDRLMTDACPAYPAYRFSSNKGYPSPDHLDSLDRWGPSPLHRHSWRPILTRTTPRLPL
jgi:ribonuclease HII